MEQTNNPQNITLYGCSEYLPHGRRRFRRTDPVESRKSRPADLFSWTLRATRANDYFLTITESRKKTAPDGTVSYDRHKIFLYKRFSKFLEGLEEVIGFIKREKPEFFEEEHPKPEEYA